MKRAVLLGIFLIVCGTSQTVHNPQTRKIDFVGPTGPTGATGPAGPIASITPSGTVNQITVTGTSPCTTSTCSWTFSVPSGFILPGTINGMTITSSTGTFTLANAKTFTVNGTMTQSVTDGSTVAFGAGGTVLYNGGALGTPSSGTATNLTGLPVSTGITGLGTGIATWLATPSSANLFTALTTKTGSGGSAVFATGPSMTGVLLTDITGSTQCLHVNTSGLITGTGSDCGSGGGGGVTSVGQSFTGGLISVAGSPITTSGTLALTVAGTSGGIPYFSAASTWASSGALTANLPVIGGGAGAAPTVGTRSGNTTAYVTTTGSQTSGDCVKIDANGNHIANGSACGGGSAPVYTTVTFSATPTFTVSTSTIQVFTITLTANVTSSTLTTTNATNGQDITYNICQDGTGSRTFVWPTNVTGAGTIDGTLSTCSRQTFRYDGTNAIAVTSMTCPACSPGIVIPGSSSGSTTLNATAAASGVVTLPAATDTLVGKATTDTLTNKTYDTAGSGNSFSINGVAATANTGTGSVVRATSPTLVTPALGVATATSVNGLTVTTSTGTLTVPNGVTMTGPASTGTVMALNQANTGTSAQTIDISAATGSNALKVPVKAGVTTSANGSIGYDSTRDMITAAQGGATADIPQTTATPANDDCVKWVVSGTKYKLGTAGAACGSGGGGFSGASGFGATFDGGGSALTAGTTVARYIQVPNACTITGYTIIVDTGTATFKTWRIAAGTAIPTISNSISTSGVAISSGTVINSSTVTDWTSTAISANDIIGINLSAVSSATLATFQVRCAGTSIVPLSNGGTNANLTASNGGIFYSTSTAGAILSGTATARQMLQSGSSTTPAWSTTTWPATTTINRILWSSAANVISDLATANSAVLVTDSGGIPSLSTTLPNIAHGTPTSITLTNGTGLPISTGVSGLGTGIATFLATPSSANMASAVTDETGSGALVFAASPTFTGTVLGAAATYTGIVSSLSDFSTGTSKTFSLGNGYFECTGTCTITMPVPAAGQQYCVRNANNIATVITFAAIGSSARYENTASTAYGTAGTGTLVSGGAAGDKMCLVGKDSTHFDIFSFNGTWTAN